MKRYKSRKKPQPQSAKSTPALPSDPVEIEIESLSHDGLGVGRFEGKVTFVSNALPGERVLARFSEAKSKFNAAHAIEILRPSPDRVEPSCPHYAECGGCDLQHLSAERQLELKQIQVLDQLQRIGQTTPNKVLLPLHSESTHYRRSARIGVNQLADGEPIVGFRRKQSNLLCQIDNCEVLDQRLENIFSVVRDALQDAGDIKMITHLEIDLGDSGGFLTIRHVKNINAELRQKLQQIADQYQLTLNFAGNDASQNEQPSAQVCYQLSNEKLWFRNGDFIQVNAGINQQMIDQAISLLAPQDNDQILDLFCGLGNFSLPLARTGAQITGIEGNISMVHQAAFNAEQNQLENCEFHCANLTESLTGVHWYRKGYNKILLDPPRAGAATIIPQLTALKPEKILYISCNPGALARDSLLLKEQGYSLEQFLVMDMFPQTHHIESMALFVKGKKPAKKPKLFGGKGLRG